MIVKETTTKIFTMFLGKGKIDNIILRIRMKSSLKFTFLLKNQRESFHQSRHKLHKHNLRLNLREFIIQATKKFDDIIIITLSLSRSWKSSHMCKEKHGYKQESCNTKRVLSRGFEVVCNIEKWWTSCR